MLDEPLTLGGTEVHDLWSPEVGDSFRVFLGECGSDPRAIVVVTDGNGLFGLTVDTVRLMQIPQLLPSLLIVGVGYPGVRTLSDAIEVRNRDLTPTAWSPFPGSGGGDQFLEFIRRTLFPWIGERWRAALDTRVYFGHSLGGLFGTQALLDPEPPFSHYLLSSPSLFWDRRSMFDREERWSAKPPDVDLRAFFGIGSLETDEGRRHEGRHLPAHHPRKPPSTYLDMVDDLLQFTQRLRTRGHRRLDLAVEVFPDEYHATVPAVVLTHGLRWLFGGG